MKQKDLKDLKKHITLSTCFVSYAIFMTSGENDAAMVCMFWFITLLFWSF